MVSYLEKTNGNTGFHEIIYFLIRSSIHYALTHVTISEASIESDLLFDDADGIDSLPNQAIFDANSAKWVVGKIDCNRLNTGSITVKSDSNS
ncbi:hypothetical protein Tco_1185325 [Tanacetum coccineum]